MTIESEKFLPNLFILGAAKCGTTTLYSYIDDMPNVCMSEPKEPYFFEAEYEKGIEHYRETCFPHWKGEPIIGEARHRNLYLPYVPKRIYEFNPDAKLLVIVRNPIERAFSHWWYVYRRGADPLHFADAVAADFERICAGWRMGSQDEMERYKLALFPHGQGLYRTYLDSGYYYEQIQRYLQYFSREQLKVVLLEDLVAKPEAVIREVAEFIGVDAASYSFEEKRENLSPLPLAANSTIRGKAYNYFLINHALPTRIRNFLRDYARQKWKPQIKALSIDKTTRKWLGEHYRAHNYNLGLFLYRDLTHWQ